MTQTPNYKFKIQQGADKFNPLISTFANFESLDTQLADVNKATINKATMSKTEQEYLIKRSGDDKLKSNYIYFNSGYNYTSGETFKVDGKSVTATTPSGAALPSNYFRTNSNIFCILNDTQLTIFSDYSLTYNEIYPVGSIYITTSSVFNPNESFIGTWDKIQSDYTLRQASGEHPVGTVFGEKTHTLNKDELPTIKGRIEYHSATTGTNVASVAHDYKPFYSHGSHYRDGGSNLLTGAKSFGGYDFEVGKNRPHNNIGPSFAVNIWKRVS